jgi:hypothetical protein
MARMKKCNRIIFFKWIETIRTSLKRPAPVHILSTSSVERLDSYIVKIPSPSQETSSTVIEKLIVVSAAAAAVVIVEIAGCYWAGGAMISNLPIVSFCAMMTRCMYYVPRSYVYIWAGDNGDIVPSHWGSAYLCSSAHQSSFRTCQRNNRKNNTTTITSKNEKNFELPAVLRHFYYLTLEKVAVVTTATYLKGYNRWPNYILLPQPANGYSNSEMIFMLPPMRFLIRKSPNMHTDYAAQCANDILKKEMILICIIPLVSGRYRWSPSLISRPKDRQKKRKLFNIHIKHSVHCEY